MTGTTNPKPLQKNETPANEPGKGICGIVMPISTMSDDYTKIHWTLVKEVIDTAIEKAGFQPRAAWVDPSKDVIHAKIIKNIYECEIIICDLSNLNPNVMLETGIRLSTKKPILIITDGVTKPPFDINPIEYIEYPRNLNYKDTILFIEELSRKILETSSLYRRGLYVPFMHHYTYEIVSPESRVITENQFIENEIRDVKSILLNLISKENKINTPELIFSGNNKIKYLVASESNIIKIEIELGRIFSMVKYEKTIDYMHKNKENITVVFSVNTDNLDDFEIRSLDLLFRKNNGIKI